MGNIQAYAKKHPGLLGGFFFLLVSVLVNLAWFALTGTPHVNDIIHALPTALIMEPIAQAMGGLLPSDLMLALPALVIDFVIGFLLGLLLGKLHKTKKGYVPLLVLTAAVYVIAVTYQWLPIL